MRKFDKIWAVYFSTGAFGTTTPTKFALDRSTTGTPVKSQLALTPNVSSSNLAVKSEVADDKAAHKPGEEVNNEVQPTTTSGEVTGETRGTVDATDVKAEPETTTAAEASINTG